jgi:hypothetical protein
MAAGLLGIHAWARRIIAWQCMGTADDRIPLIPPINRRASPVFFSLRADHNLDGADDPIYTVC